MMDSISPFCFYDSPQIQVSQAYLKYLIAVKEFVSDPEFLKDLKGLAERKVEKGECTHALKSFLKRNFLDQADARDDLLFFSREEESILKKIRNKKPEHPTYTVEIMELEEGDLPNIVSEFSILDWKIEEKKLVMLIEYPNVREPGVQAMLQGNSLYLVGGEVDEDHPTKYHKCTIEVNLSTLKGEIDLKIIHPQLRACNSARVEVITTYASH
jgi:hypothetical protein